MRKMRLDKRRCASSAGGAPPLPPAEYTGPPPPKARHDMGLRSTLKRIWPSFGRSRLGGGTRSHDTEAVTRVPDPSRTTHSAAPCERDSVKRRGRASVGSRPSDRTVTDDDELVAHLRAKERSLEESERPDASSRRGRPPVAVAIVDFINTTGK